MNNIEKSVKLLNDGDLVGIPTETVYGLAASIQNEQGIKKIFSLKDRPFFDPLIVHISSIEQAKKYTCLWNEICQKLAEKFWPGPLTLIVPKNDKISDLITSGHDTVGLRMPAHPMALELIKKLGHPVAAPSANKFKQTSPTSAAHVRAEFPNLFILDGGDCEVGIESTIVSINENKAQILRPGMINIEQITEALGNISVVYSKSPVAPGQLIHHYMPKLPIIVSSNYALDKNLPAAPRELKNNAVEIKLHHDPQIVARSLYSMLREVDLQRYSAIYIELPNGTNLDAKWNGIINRITKAASFKIF